MAKYTRCSATECFSPVRIGILIAVFSAFISYAHAGEALPDSLERALGSEKENYGILHVVSCARMNTQAKAFAAISKAKNAAHGDYLAQFSLINGTWQLDWVDANRRHHPWKILTADFDGDSREELAVCVRKKPKFWKDTCNGFFVYRVSDKSIAPMWLGSRMSEPYIDAEILSTGGASRLLCLESDGKRKRVVEYEWKSFGFYVVRIHSRNTNANTIFEYLKMQKESE